MEPLTPDDPPMIGGYRLLARLGEGGTGLVYLAHTATRRVVVKTIRPAIANEPLFRVRFAREVALAQQVSSRYTATVLAADPDALRPWLATDYVPGPSLRDAVRSAGALPDWSLLLLATGLAEALRAVHRAGVVHHDLQPANVLLASDGPRLIDFGVSRPAEQRAPNGLPVTAAGRALGTPPYMSPEQFVEGQPTGAPSDVFSLGGVLYYAATARKPFGGYDGGLAARVLGVDPPLEPVPQSLRPLVAACLRKEPEDRWTPEEISAFLKGGPIPPCRAEPAGAGADAARPSGGGSEMGSTREDTLPAPPVPIPPRHPERLPRNGVAPEGPAPVRSPGTPSALPGPPAPSAPLRYGFGAVTLAAVAPVLSLAAVPLLPSLLRSAGAPAATDALHGMLTAFLVGCLVPLAWGQLLLGFGPGFRPAAAARTTLRLYLGAALLFSAVVAYSLIVTTGGGDGGMSVNRVLAGAWVPLLALLAPLIAWEELARGRAELSLLRRSYAMAHLPFPALALLFLVLWSHPPTGDAALVLGSLIVLFTYAQLFQQTVLLADGQVAGDGSDAIVAANTALAGLALQIPVVLAGLWFGLPPLLLASLATCALAPLSLQLLLLLLRDGPAGTHMHSGEEGDRSWSR